MPRICIVTNAPISQNPRAAKEADALSAAGYDVTVIFAQHADWLRDNDEALVRRARWRGVSVKAWPGGVLPRLRTTILRARSAFFRILAKFSTIAPIPELACSRFLVEQVWLAVRTRADLYIGHNPPSLPVVAWAARLTRAKYGFDFEDFHAGEKPPGAAPSLSDTLADILIRRYLPGATSVTAASWGIAEEVGKAYRVSRPPTVLNVFPWSDRAVVSHESSSRFSDRPLSLYWFSQIVGCDRGLEDAIVAVGQASTPVMLHIRGVASPEVKSALIEVARRNGAASKVAFHGLAPSYEVLKSCVEHDVGLCLEVPATVNHDICISNKIFIYMLAGLAIIASRTRGQQEVLDASPGAGFLYQSGNSAELASIIDRLGSNRDLLQHARSSALEAARRRWNWELESRVLVEAIDAALSVSRMQASPVVIDA